MALKYGSSSKSSTFKRSAFPMQSGTTSHASALKQDSDYKKKLEQREAQLKLEDIERKEAERVKEANKTKPGTTEYEAEQKRIKTEKAATEASKGTHPGQEKKRWTLRNILNKKGEKKLDFKERIAKMDERQLKKGYKKYFKKETGDDYKNYKKEINAANKEARKSGGKTTTYMNQADWFADQQSKGKYEGVHKDAASYGASDEYKDPQTKREARLRKLSEMTPEEYEATDLSPEARRAEFGAALDEAGQTISRAYGPGGTGTMNVARSEMKREAETSKSQDILDRIRQMHLDQHETKIADAENPLEVPGTNPVAGTEETTNLDQENIEETTTEETNDSTE